MKKLVIIGCGGIGHYHLSHILHFMGEEWFTSQIEFAACCDLIEDRAEGVAAQTEKERGVRPAVYTDYRAMLDAVKPDIAFVCVPPTCHGDIERDLIARGIHFFVEKPVALDLDLAAEIRDAAEAARLVTAVGFQCRYSALVEPNKRFCEDHNIVLVQCARVGGIPGVDWWRKRSTSGGQIVEQTIHQYDIIRYMIGDPVEVFTFGARGFVKMEGYDTEDASVTAIKFASGAVGSIVTGCYATSGAAMDSKVTFSAADCRADLAILDYFRVYGVSGEAAEKSGLILANDGTMKSSTSGAIEFREQGDAGIPCDRTFLEGALTGDGSKVRSPYRDAVRSLAFTLACNESIDTGKCIRIKY